MHFPNSGDTILDGMLTRHQEKPLPQDPEFHHELEEFKSNPRAIVSFDGPNDPYNPLNWPFSRKIKNTLLYGFTTMGSTWASSM